MAASGQIRPSSGYNNVGADYISPVTAASDIDVCTTSTANVPIARFKNSDVSLRVDRIGEITAANGVDVDGSLLKDGSIKVTNNNYITAINAAGSGSQNIAKIDASNQLIFASVAAATRNSLALGGTYTDALASSGVATSTTTSATILSIAPTLEADEIVLYYATGGLSGSANAACTLALQVDASNYIIGYYQNHATAYTDAKSFPYIGQLVQTAPSAAVHTYRLVITVTAGTIYYRDMYAVCLRIRNNR